MPNNEQNNLEMRKGILNALTELSSSLGDDVLGCNIIVLREKGKDLETVTQVFPANEFALLKLAKTNIMTAIGILEQLFRGSEELQKDMGIENLKEAVSQINENSKILAFSSLLSSICDTEGEIDDFFKGLSEEFNELQGKELNIEEAFSDDGSNEKDDQDFSRL